MSKQTRIEIKKITTVTEVGGEKEEDIRYHVTKNLYSLTPGDESRVIGSQFIFLGEKEIRELIAELNKIEL